MPEIIVAEEHGQIYDVWVERGVHDLKLSHIDFHCDMRGLYIDRRRGRARAVDPDHPRHRVPDSGNFLAHAILNGIVTGVRWVHDPYGGRRFDVGTVKYEGDLSAIPHRLGHRWRGGREVALAFEELTFECWDGVRPGEHLDIDWDGIASIDYADDHIRRLVRDFLARPFPAVPETTHLIYSPGYSHPDRALFEDFLAALAAKLGGATIRHLGPPPGPPPRAGRRSLAARASRTAVLACHRVGIY